MSMLLTTASLVAADGPAGGFRASAEKGYYEFDTGVLRGKMRLDGKWQGICSVVHAATGIELAKPPGLLSYYRMFTTNKRYGDAVRDWPAAVRVLPDGGLEITFAPQAAHPVEVRGVFRWVRPDTIDLETTVTPQSDMPQFELFLSNYVAPGLDGSVYLQTNRFNKLAAAGLVRADWHPLIDGNYLMFPRDLAGNRLICDGRWEYPSNPVQWAVGRYMAGPLVVRRDATNGLAVALMAPPEDCFAVAVPYNKTPPDLVAGHSSMYLSLFGRDLSAGQPACVRTRIVIRKDLTDKEALGLFEDYCAGK